MQAKIIHETDEHAASPSPAPKPLSKPAAKQPDKQPAASAKPKSMLQPRFWVALFCVGGVIMLGSLLRVTRLYQTTVAQADKLRDELVVEQSEKQRLIRERDFKSTNAYIEREARIEYGMLYEGDIRFVAGIAPVEDDWDDMGGVTAVFAPIE